MTFKRLTTLSATGAHDFKLEHTEIQNLEDGLVHECHTHTIIKFIRILFYLKTSETWERIVSTQLLWYGDMVGYSDYVLRKAPLE